MIRIEPTMPVENIEGVDYHSGCIEALTGPALCKEVVLYLRV
jgi:hypothetical protein